MALYTFECRICGWFDDLFSSVEDRDAVRFCPDCAAVDCAVEVTRIITPPRLVGPTDTKPRQVNNQTVTSLVQEGRVEARAEKGVSIVSKTDSSIKNKQTAIRHKQELKAQSKGFRNERHRQAEVRKERQFLREKT